MGKIENIDVFRQKVSDITDSLSAAVQVGKIAQKIDDVSEAAKQHGYEFKTIISHAALANVELANSNQSHMRHWLTEAFGAGIATKAMEIAQLSTQLETFVYQHAVAIITPSDFNNRRPAHQTEKDLRETLVKVGEIGQMQAGEIVKQCKKLIESALIETARTV